MLLSVRLSVCLSIYLFRAIAQKRRIYGYGYSILKEDAMLPMMLQVEFTGERKVAEPTINEAVAMPLQKSNCQRRRMHIVSLHDTL